jgi:hypothetical protein
MGPPGFKQSGTEIGGQEVGKAKRAEGEKMTVQGERHPGEYADRNSTS